MVFVTAISSSVGKGGVGLSAIIPLYQMLGHTVKAIPSVFFPLRPDLEKSIPSITSPDILSQHLIQNLAKSDSILLGYFANLAQIETVVRVFKDQENNAQKMIKVIDPVMGDDGRLYVSSDIVEGIQQKLLPHADILTPNRFEADVLFGIEGLDFQQTSRVLADIFNNKYRPIIIITSAEISQDKIEIWYWDNNVNGHIYRHKKYHNPPRGTGDCFSGLVALNAAKGELLSDNIEHASQAVLQLVESAAHCDARKPQAFLDDIIKQSSQI